MRFTAWAHRKCIHSRNLICMNIHNTFKPYDLLKTTLSSNNSCYANIFHQGKDKSLDILFLQYFENFIDFVLHVLILLFIKFILIVVDYGSNDYVE